MSYVEEAKKLRPIIEEASKFLSDEVAQDAPELFPSWKPNGYDYKVKDRVHFGEYLYKCILDHTSQEDWPPNEAVSLWVKIADPAIEWPDWVQPIGAHDAYAKGDKVTHNDKHWISEIDANVYEPGVYGWTEAGEESE